MNLLSKTAFACSSWDFLYKFVNVLNLTKVPIVGLVWAALLIPVCEDSMVAAQAQDGQSAASDQTSWKELRKKAAHRQRRMIYNNDGADAVVYAAVATPEAMLASRSTPLIGTQVDTIFYCTTCSSFRWFSHATKIGDVLTRKEPDLLNNKVAEFFAQGTDPLKITVDFAKKNGFEIFWSLRMNDTHDANKTYGPLLFPQLKKDHPDWLLGSKKNPPKYGTWTAVDYGRKEIRDLAFRYIEEVCRNYDVDGIEMDFFRHLNYFKEPAMGHDATKAQCNMMTGLLRRVRRMTEREGQKRGRPILVAVRVPDSAGYCKALGLDIVRWLEDDLIDIMVASGYFRLNPWEVSVELGHKYDVPVYPSLDEPRFADAQAQEVRLSLECYRARAMNAWAAGVDGVYIYNARHKFKRALLGDPKRLERMDKVYTTGARDLAMAGSYLAGANRFLNRSPLSPDTPIKLEPGKTASVELPVGQKLDASNGDAQPPKVQLRLRVSGLQEAGDLSVALNAKPLTGGTLSETWLEFAVDPALVAKGANRIEVTLGEDQQAGPALLDLLLWVRYPKAT